MLYALFVFTIIFASENPRTHQRQASVFKTVVWDRTSPKQLCSSFHSCPIAFMIKLFCCSSSLATATCFQTEQLLTQTMQSNVRLSTQYKGSTQSFWIITRQNHHFSLAGMHWWRNTSSLCQAASQIISSLSLIKVCALCSSEQTHLIVKLGVLLCSLPWRNVKSAWRSVRYRADISEIIFDEVKLPRHQGNDLPQKKVLSMAKKCCTIPTDKLF